MNWQSYLVPGFFLAFLGWRFWRFRLVRRQLPGLLAEGAVIVDVRSPAEFAGGANPGSRNIPLEEIAAACAQLDPGKPVIVCCASGTRSAMAAGVLRAKGFGKVVNAGPWKNTLI
jgi:phage shock protein E